MNPSINTLRELAGRIKDGDPMAIDQLQDSLHPGMVMVIRRALRTGSGGPMLKRWLGQALKSMPDAPDADELASAICKGLVHNLRPDPVSSTETVVEGGIRVSSIASY